MLFDEAVSSMVFKVRFFFNEYDEKEASTSDSALGGFHPVYKVNL